MTRGGLLVTLMLALLGSSVSARPQMSVDVGWNDFYRVGRWNPVFVTASDSTHRQVVLQLYAPTDHRYALKIQQRGLVVGPSEWTVALYAPLTHNLTEGTIEMRNAETGRLLAQLPLDDWSNWPRRGVAVNPGDVFIGVSGAPSAGRLLQSQFSQEKFHVSYLSGSRLPAVPIGYDPLDLLILAEPDLVRLSNDHQQAIIDWVRAGGRLLLWPGAEPIPTSGPIIGALPCVIGDNHVYEIDAKALAGAGLGARFARLNGRQFAGHPDAKAIKLLDSAALRAFHKRYGLGEVMVLPIDVSTFMFASVEQAQGFWEPLLERLDVRVDTTQPDFWYQPTPKHQGVDRAMEWLADIPGVGQFGFGYVAIVLIGMMFIVGPLDWIVLKRLNLQPWTWVTTSGWIALITLSAIFIGQTIRSGDLYFSAVTVIDEIDGARVAASDVVSIYSPRTTDYRIECDPYGWWQPPTSASFGRSSLRIDIPSQQDRRGSRPTKLRINVWNMRFLEGTVFGPSSAGIVEAQISMTPRNPHYIRGTITNHSESALENVVIRTDVGSATLGDPIAPGQTVAVNAAVVPPHPRNTTLQPNRLPEPQSDDIKPSRVTLGQIAHGRTGRIDQLLERDPGLACIIAEFSGAPAAIELNEPSAKRRHTGLVRALVTLQSSRETE